MTQDDRRDRWTDEPEVGPRELDDLIPATLWRTCTPRPSG